MGWLPITKTLPAANLAVLDGELRSQLVSNYGGLRGTPSNLEILVRVDDALTRQRIDAVLAAHDPNSETLRDTVAKIARSTVLFSNPIANLAQYDNWAVNASQEAFRREVARVLALYRIERERE